MIDFSSFLFISCFIATFMLNAATHLLMRMITALLVNMNNVSSSLGQIKIFRSVLSDGHDFDNGQLS